jgi:hypothetical protein
VGYASPTAAVQKISFSQDLQLIGFYGGPLVGPQISYIGFISYRTSECSAGYGDPLTPDSPADQLDTKITP